MIQFVGFLTEEIPSVGLIARGRIVNIFAIEYGCRARVAARFVVTVVLSMVLAATVIGCGGSEKQSGQFRMNKSKFSNPAGSTGCNPC
ncbi:MAG: hypothetical protein CL790_05605 [Chloroflexi bacterium]|nr:hypothetical protein [Chloroflexota bacterium]